MVTKNVENKDFALKEVANVLMNLGIFNLVDHLKLEKKERKKALNNAKIEDLNFVEEYEDLNIIKGSCNILNFKLKISFNKEYDMLYINNFQEFSDYFNIKYNSGNYNYFLKKIIKKLDKNTKSPEPKKELLTEAELKSCLKQLKKRTRI